MTGKEGPARQPLFTCTVTAAVTGIAGLARARGTGGSKAAAKASAAAALLAALADDKFSPPVDGIKPIFPNERWCTRPPPVNPLRWPTTAGRLHGSRGGSLTFAGCGGAYWQTSALATCPS
jgi:hypothetical protein